jgi:hypothetical protein
MSISPTNHLRSHPSTLTKAKNVCASAFKMSWFALLVGLNYVKGHHQKLGQFFLGEMGLLSDGI